MNWYKFTEAEAVWKAAAAVILSPSGASYRLSESIAGAPRRYMSGYVTR
jgi:hypothetical protein